VGGHKNQTGKKSAPRSHFVYVRGSRVALARASGEWVFQKNLVGAVGIGTSVHIYIAQLTENLPLKNLKT
jgi:hypothetical protein